MDLVEAMPLTFHNGISALQSLMTEGVGLSHLGNHGDSAVSLKTHSWTTLTCEPWCTDARAVQALAVAGSAIQTADVSTGVLVQFTVCSCREANEKG